MKSTDGRVHNANVIRTTSDENETENVFCEKLNFKICARIFT